GGGMYGGGGYGGGMYGGGMYGGMGGYGNQNPYGQQMYAPNVPMVAASPLAVQTAANPAAATSPDLTGSYLGNPVYGAVPGPRMPHVIPNPFDNTLLIQGTPQE